MLEIINITEPDLEKTELEKQAQERLKLIEQYKKHLEQTQLQIIEIDFEK